MRHVDDSGESPRAMSCRFIARAIDDRAAANDAGARISADHVRELGGLRDVPCGEIGALAGGDRPPIGEPERARRVFRHSGERLLRRQSEQRAGEIEHQHERNHRRSAGIAVGRDRHRDAVRAERRNRRHARFAQHVKRARQQHGDRFRRAPSPPRRPRSSIRDDRRTARRIPRPARRRPYRTADLHAA